MSTGANPYIKVMDPYDLYTPSQKQIYRAIAGAVRNAAHGHPNWPLRHEMARSIAKRATGTLTSQWREALAAKPSESADFSLVRRKEGQICGSRPTERKSKGSVAETSRVGAKRRSPLRLLHNHLGALVKEAKHEGRTERVEALQDALRLLDRISRGEAVPPSGKSSTGA